LARKTNKTNALRLLELAGVEFEVRQYDLAMEEFSASAVAALINLPPSQVFKTLVANGDRSGYCFAVVPADAELDLKALARACKERKMSMVPVKDVEPLTGYRRGSVTAIGARKQFPVALDASAAHLEHIAVSGGARGLQIVLATSDYVAATGAQLVALT
jgi:Cys-tRNA(Pro)/Cys-tRNA(Cys) deacylase